jgi:hypothetical protein
VSRGGERFSVCRDDRAKAAAVGRFLAHFRLESREHTQKGTSYRGDEAIAKLRSHVPSQTVSAVRSVIAHVQPVENTQASDRVTDVTLPGEMTGETVEVEL